MRARYARGRSVAIPNFTSAGLLPTGIHLATLEEVEFAFGCGTDTRIRLYESLRAFLELARSFQMFTSIVIDGSFVTNEPDPSDVDVVLILPGPQLKRLMKHSDYLKLENAAIRERFAIDLFIDPDLEGMATFFQRLKIEDALQRGVPPRHLRGVVQVAL
jgi:predicted nucleotidyltransferase